MNKILYYINKHKIFFIIIGIIFLILLFSFPYFYNEYKNKNEKVVVKKEEQKKEIKEEVIETIKVDIKGYVQAPGVYEMDINSRVIDVINKAGGLLKEANTEYINLSKKIEDEMIIIIYSNKEVDKYKKEEKETIYIEYECKCPDNKNNACITEKDTVNTNGTKLKETSSEDNLISINTDNIEELMKLSGIGESRAKSIIQYRKDNGDFEKLEDIMNVSGIGESAYSKIKENIKL